MPIENIIYDHSIVDPSDSTITWHFKIIEDSVSGEFSFTEIQDQNGYILATTEVPEFVLVAIVQALESHKGSYLQRFERYSLLYSGTYEVGDTNVDLHVGHLEGTIESGSRYLIVVVTAGIASGLDLGTTFDEQSLLIDEEIDTAEYVSTNFTGQDEIDSFDFKFGANFSADDDYDNAHIKVLLNGVYVFIDERGNVYSAFQGHAAQGGHFALFRINDGISL